jgi:putative endonuclease
MVKPWIVYILRCNDNSFYTGITIDLERRILEHNTSNKGAKYTRCRRPVTLLKSFFVENKSQALKLEYKIKQLSHQEKLEFVYGDYNER